MHPGGRPHMRQSPSWVPNHSYMPPLVPAPLDGAVERPDHDVPRLRRTRPLRRSGPRPTAERAGGGAPRPLALVRCGELTAGRTVAPAGGLRRSQGDADVHECGAPGRRVTLRLGACGPEAVRDGLVVLGGLRTRVRGPVRSKPALRHVPEPRGEVVGSDVRGSGQGIGNDEPGKVLLRLRRHLRAEVLNVLDLDVRSICKRLHPRQQRRQRHSPQHARSARTDGTFPRSDSPYDHKRGRYICPAGKELMRSRHNFATPRSGKGLRPRPVGPQAPNSNTQIIGFQRLTFDGVERAKPIRLVVHRSP